MIFSATTEASSGIDSAWNAKTGEQRSLLMSIPSQFGGPDSGLSPEDLFISALANCYIATLKVIAANSKMTFDSITGTAELTLDRDDAAAAPWMKWADLKFVVTGVSNQERFLRMMERVSKQCMIINSVKTEVRFTFEAHPTSA